jgi:hypothetical protein
MTSIIFVSCPCGRLPATFSSAAMTARIVIGPADGGAALGSLPYHPSSPARLGHLSPQSPHDPIFSRRVLRASGLPGHHGKPAAVSHAGSPQ